MDALKSLKFAPFTRKEPVIFVEPVNSCLSVIWSPNFVEPVENNIDAVSYWATTSYTVNLPLIVTFPFTTSFPVIVTLLLIVWGPVNTFPAEPVCAEYWLVYLLKFCTVIFSVIPSCTIGTNTIEPDIVVIKGNSDIFLSAIFLYYFVKLVFNSYKY